MRLPVTLLIIALAPVSARADFVLHATPSAGPMVRQPMPNEHPKPLPVAKPPTPRPLAQGFGHDVPLESALKQILPDGMQAKVTSAVDAQERVNWSGGKPWDVVLRDAIKPLGIKVAVADKEVALSR